MRQCLRRKTFVARHMTIVAGQNHYIVRQKIQPYDKTVIASIPQNIGFVQY